MFIKTVCILSGDCMVTETNTVVKHLMEMDRWQLCQIYHGDNKKRFCGYRDGHWSSAATNKIDGCTSHNIVASKIKEVSKSATSFSLYRTYYINDDDPVIGIDIDKVEESFPLLPFAIPFPVLDYFVEYSPSNTGLHIWCLVTPEVKQEFLNQHDFRGIVIDKSHQYCKQVEYRMAKCLLTVTGKAYKGNTGFIVANTIQNTTSNTFGIIDAKYASILMDCISSSKAFEDAFTNNYTQEERVAFDTNGLSEYLFSLARVIYQRTGGSTDPELYYQLLSHLPIVQQTPKWSKAKLKRWCETHTTFNSIERVEKEKAAILPDLPPAQINELDAAPQSLVIDPKAPEGVLVPLFFKAYENVLYPTAVGMYRYSECQKVYIKYTKADIVAFAEDFYRKLLPQKSVSSVYALAQAAVRYVYNVYAENLSVSFPHNPELLHSNPEHLCLHLNDSIYDVECNSFIDETPLLLSTSKLSVARDILEHCFNSYAELYGSSSWKAFLESSFNHDTETIESLQRFFGYVISKDYDKQKALVLRGEAGSGKGTLISVISTVLNATIASTSMQQMDEKFGYSTCLDKQLLVFPEMPRNMRKYHGAWERLKALISADPVSVELKGQQAFSTVLKTKVIICSNYDLSYDGDMNSLNRRLVYCTLPQSFGGNKELEVDYRSLLSTPEEQALILAWIIEGYKLYKLHGLMQSSKGKSALEDATEDTDLIADFIKQELTIVSPNEDGFVSSFINNNEIKAAFKRFCMNNNIQNTFSDRFLPTKIKSYIAKKLSVATTILDMRTSDSRGIRGVKFKDANNYEDPPF